VLKRAPLCPRTTASEYHDASRSFLTFGQRRASWATGTAIIERNRGANKKNLRKKPHTRKYEARYQVYAQAYPQRLRLQSETLNLSMRISWRQQAIRCALSAPRKPSLTLKPRASKFAAMAATPFDFGASLLSCPQVTPRTGRWPTGQAQSKWLTIPVQKCKETI
jgi:hypothetical protein